MKFRSVFLLSLATLFSLNMIIIGYEYFTALSFQAQVMKPSRGLPENSATLQKAKQETEFQTVEHKAAQKRISRLKDEAFRNILILAIFAFFLNKNLRQKLCGMSKVRITVIKKSWFDENLQEINYISLMMVLMAMVLYGSSPTRHIIGEAARGFLPALVFYILVFALILPFVVLALLKLLKAYKSSFILICYAAYFLKSVSELMSEDEVDLTQMEKITPDGFSKAVQNILQEQNLQNKIYREKVKSKSINAALVGWGSGERIEIYGDHEDFTDSEFESVLIHEIGHSQNNSLVKKILVLFTIKLVEMVILLMCYRHLTKYYSDEALSISGSFMVLYLIYSVVGKKWLMMFHKLTSHYAEIAADLTAKGLGYGKKLSNVLFAITIKSGDYIYTSFVYNALRSYHPTIYDRIEYLN